MLSSSTVQLVQCLANPAHVHQTCFPPCLQPGLFACMHLQIVTIVTIVTFCSVHLGQICPFLMEVHALITCIHSHSRNAAGLELYLFLYRLQLKSKLGPRLDACLIIRWPKFAIGTLVRIVACVQL